MYLSLNVLLINVKTFDVLARKLKPTIFHFSILSNLFRPRVYVTWFLALKKWYNEMDMNGQHKLSPKFTKWDKKTPSLNSNNHILGNNKVQILGYNQFPKGCG
jgi:hypothetical protein